MLGITELTYTALISFLIVVILGPIFIPMLTKFKFGQTVRNDGPKTHLAKNGTPTMGGILMIVAILITGYGYRSYMYIWIWVNRFYR